MGDTTGGADPLRAEAAMRPPVAARVARRVDVLTAAAAGADARAPGSAASGRLRAKALDLLRDEALAEPAYCYRVVVLDDIGGGTLYAEGVALNAGRLLPPSGRLTALAAAVCTLGPRIEAQVRELFAERRTALAITLDTLANELLSRLSRRAQDRLHADVLRRGLTMAGELRPGDPGLDLDAQPGVLRLAGAEAIGVSLTEGLLMTPHKSTSMVLGVGVDLPPARWSRCDTCPTRDRCRMLQSGSATAGGAAAVAA